MDAMTQDSIERLARGNEWARFMHHIQDRKDSYLASLTTIDPSMSHLVARVQGNVEAMNVILRLEEEVSELKRARTNDV